MSVKILAIGDPHFRPSTQSLDRLMVDEIVRVAELQNPDYIISMGDTIDTKSDLTSPQLNLVTELFLRLSAITKLLVIIGNHDLSNEQAYLTDKHAFNSYKQWNNVEVFDLPRTLSVQDPDTNKTHLISVVPYTPPGMLLETMDKYIPDWMKSDIIFSHQELAGSSFGVAKSKNGDEYPEDAPFMVLGHIHVRQLLKKNALYIGTPRTTAHGDDSEKTISLFTLDNGNISEELIKLNLPRHLTFTTALSKIDELVLPEGQVLRVIVQGKASNLISFKNSKTYKSLEKKAKIVLEAEKVTTSLQDSAHSERKTYKQVILESLKQKPNLLKLFEKITHLN